MGGSMTYEALKDIISEMTLEQLKSDVTVWIDEEDEFYPVKKLEFANAERDDRLDEGHPIFIVLK
jgi:hypothetical protein